MVCVGWWELVIVVVTNEIYILIFHNEKSVNNTENLKTKEIA